jgi:membrane-associated protease RseP (regulator of RpoE activity)
MDGSEENGHRRIPSEAESGEEPHVIAQTADDEADADEGAPSFFSEWGLPIGLFLLTCFTTLWAGAYQSYNGPVRGPLNFLLEQPEALWRGLPFAAALLFILTTHELGHYLLSRIHGMPASPPLFIPGPPHFIGTFGAIIRMRGPIMDRRALFDIGVAGPLAGFIVAVAVLIVGLNLSTVVDRTATFGLHLGEPLLLQFLAWLVIGPISPESDIVLHPIAFAAWFGFFVTSLNLLPIGQLDGGHVAYALWGGRQRTMAFIAVPILIVLGFVGWPGWFLWAFMAGLWGLGHPPVRDPHAPLGRNRTIVGWIALAVFVSTFAPVPFSFHS